MKSLFLILVFITHSLSSDFEITRVYKSSSRYLRAVVKTNEQIEVKCAIMDDRGQPITVATQYIKPPFDEVLLRVPDGMMNQAKNVECYK